ncbi:hypothetical protein J4447_04850 [Candidatus Pacearchaeota archaeon]|nr:hypothetical protein [Candidatus Pacearchaeota archaeon]
MENKTIMWIVIAVLFLAVLFLTFKVSQLTGSAVTGSVSSVQTSGQIDTSGWTENEIMNYEMHGTIPARVQESSSGAGADSSGYGGMVGGC